MERKKILLTTGIYPPKIGGPAQYAKNLKDSFENLGHQVRVETYTIEDKLPTGIRHFFFFLKIIRKIIWCDYVVSLDTFSVGLPTVVASKIFNKKSLIRTGGDFLWEQYSERTKKKVLLRNFYKTEKNYFTQKEEIVFKLTNWTLQNVSTLIFSTDWQRNIFLEAYKIDKNKTEIIENYYGPKESDYDFEAKEFVASARNLSWKNFDILEEVFDEIRKDYQDVFLFKQNLKYNEFMQKMSRVYAVILVSLGDISPNMIMDAIRLNRPFICTKEVGIFDRIKDAGIFVDPLNKSEIKEAVQNLLTEDGYKKAKEKVRDFNFVHTWDDIAKEFTNYF